MSTWNPSSSHTYLFTVIDRTSQWLETISLSSVTAEECTRALFAGRISRFGVPAITRGAQITSALYAAALCHLLNITNNSIPPEVGKMTIDYLLPLSKPSTRQVADIVYLKKSVGSRG
jgi:hypothetical protein